ncbi:MAG: hypothetical protein MUP58_01030 [Candidatus Nanohaloarchaeota archaeon QJJ-9]|nr:hypothetical protein [Candidatus Nanohaloarchaeota archaeon QJJ-9]
MEEVEVELEERSLRFGEVELQLSNYDIKHLGELVEGRLDGQKVENAVSEVLEEQIVPFLEDTDRLPNQPNVEKEIEEAFSTHLYSYVEPE